MSIFDKLKSAPPVTSAPSTGNSPSVCAVFTFTSLPESLQEMQSLPEASLNNPYQTAALTVLALCAYAADKAIGADMLNWLRGPRPLSNFDLSFLNDRFRDGKPYIPFSYFKGSSPENNYTPEAPYNLTVESNPYSDANPGYKKLFLRSGGADSPREVILRQKSDGTWLLWDQALLVGIREPKATDPWA